MESRFINRYNTFCQSLENLEKSKTADPREPFVLEGTVQNFNLTFDISWKVMKDILVKDMGVLDFAAGSPRETLQQAFMNGLISDDNWLSMLRIRNALAHDYNGTLAKKSFQDIVNVYIPLLEEFRDQAKRYYSQE